MIWFVYGESLCLLMPCVVMALVASVNSVNVVDSLYFWIGCCCVVALRGKLAHTSHRIIVLMCSITSPHALNDFTYKYHPMVLTLNHATEVTEKERHNHKNTFKKIIKINTATPGAFIHYSIKSLTASQSRRFLY